MRLLPKLIAMLLLERFERPLQFPELFFTRDPTLHF